jgi:hypothetical protein
MLHEEKSKIMEEKQALIKENQSILEDKLRVTKEEEQMQLELTRTKLAHIEVHDRKGGIRTCVLGEYYRERESERARERERPSSKGTKEREDR